MINGYYVNTVAANAPLVPVEFGYGDESDVGPPGEVGYPMSNSLIVEGAVATASGPRPGLAPGSDAGSDCHLFIHQPGRNNRDLLYELYAVSEGPGQAVSWMGGSVFDLRSNKMRPDGWTSANAAGIAHVPCLIKYNEVASGRINHMLTIGIPGTQRSYLWPASHQAGSSNNNYPKMGGVWVLNSNFNISGFSQKNQVILTALKEYGAIISDNGMLSLLGEYDPRWSDDELHSLLSVKLNNGTFRDVSSLKFAPNSYAAGTGPASVSSTSSDSSGSDTTTGVMTMKSHHTKSLPRAR